MELTDNKGAYAGICPVGGKMAELLASGIRRDGVMVIPENFCDVDIRPGDSAFR